MDTMEVMRARHRVRQYLAQPLEDAVCRALQAEISACNVSGKLHLQLVTDEPKAFDCLMAHYGRFSGVTNYIALVGTKGKQLDELCGYYGERLVLKAQQLGLNTCWVAASYKKVPGALKIGAGEKLVAVIALGYGKTQGVPHSGKTAQDVSNVTDDAPDWFRAGVEAALLAPTALNQQKFTLTRSGTTVSAKAGRGFYTKIDLGIVKYHFELATGRENFNWG